MAKRTKRLTKKERKAAFAAARCSKWMWSCESEADYQCVRLSGHKGACSISRIW
jgi:hypothetical protein